ncbi:MAG TPA: desulfoferrodoxin [Candidatus Dorea intestinavium]|nr:desulfoferrodoxin [Candidatus Dorea intestinavium]
MRDFFKEVTTGNIVTETTSFQAAPDKSEYEKLTAKTEDAATEKHVPVVKQEGNKVEVVVGSTLHPMTEEHYITAIYIETKNGGQYRALKAGDEPKAVFTIEDGDEFVAAYEYCNIHGLWKD